MNEAPIFTQPAIGQPILARVTKDVTVVIHPDIAAREVALLSDRCARQVMAIHQLQDSLTRRNEEIAELHQQNERLTTENGRLSGANGILAKDASKLKDDVRILQDHLKAADMRAGNFRAQTDLLAKDVNTLRSALDGAVQQRDTLTRELNEARRAAGEAGRLQRDLSLAQHTIECRGKVIDDLHQKLVVAERNRITVTPQVPVDAEYINNLKYALADRNQTIESLRAKVAILDKARTSLDEQCEALHEERDALREERDALLLDCRQWRQRGDYLAARGAEIASLRDKLQATNTKLTQDRTRLIGAVHGAQRVLGPLPSNGPTWTAWQSLVKGLDDIGEDHFAYQGEQQ